jgi:hypothetical protein
VLGIAAGSGQWGEMAWVPALLLVLAAAAWLALGFQRHLLLGAVVRESGAGPWRRYGLYLLAVAILGVLFAVLSGMFLTLALPAMAWFLMALNSPAPSLAAGSVVLGVLALGIAAYPPARLALVLPALAVGHGPSPARIWRLSRRNGLRLLALLVLIPGLLQELLALALPADDHALLNTIPGVLLGSYLALVDTAILALAYRALSDQALPVVSPGRAGAWPALSARVAGPLVLLVLVGLGGAALWDAFYRVEPKIPIIEEARPIPEAASYSAEGDGRFLTVSKESLSLRYRIQWRITDAETYARAVAGEAARANARIDGLAVRTLRNRIGTLSLDQVRRLVDADGAALGVDDGRRANAWQGDALEKLNARVRELGIEMTSWRVELVAQPAT